MASLDTIPVEERKLNLASVPSKPFDDGDFRPYPEPLQSMPFTVRAGPSSPLYLDSLPTSSITFRTSLLGLPVRTKAGLPRLKDGAKQDISIFNQDQGLPGNASLCILQDSRGWLWVGTDNGICRYDGEYCENYTTEQGLSSNNVFALSEDQNGNIWLSNSTGGVDIIDLAESTISHLIGPPEFMSDFNQCLVVDSHNQVWIGTYRHGIYLIDAQRKTIKNINTDNGLSDYETYTILENKDGTVWVGSFQGLDILDFTEKKMFHPTAEFGRYTVMDLTLDTYQNVWITTRSSGLDIFDQSAKTLYRMTKGNGLVSNVVKDVYFDAGGLGWIGTVANGVNVVDYKRGLIRQITENEGLSNNNIAMMSGDSQGQVWIGTMAGANIINLYGGALKHLTAAGGLTSTNMKGFLVDSKNTIWLASLPGGLDMIDRRTQTLKNVSDYLKIQTMGFWDICEDQAGNIWAASSNGVYVIDREKGVLRHYFQGLGEANVKHLFLDKEGNAWASVADGGLVVIDSKNKTLRYLNEANGLGNNYAGDVWQAANGEIWVASEGAGITVVNPAAMTLRYLRVREGLPNDAIRAITPDSRQRVWLATYGGGVAMLDLSKQQMTTFTPAHGLGNMSVVSLQEWQGKMYAGTVKGLTQIREVQQEKDASRWVLKNLTKHQGFLKDDFNTNAFMITREGQFWLGAGDVLTIMNRTFDAPEAGFQPPAYVTRLDIMDTPRNFIGKGFLTNLLGRVDTLWSRTDTTFLTQSSQPADTTLLGRSSIEWDSLSGAWHLPVGLVLPYNQNHLTFHFTGTHLNNPASTRYRYFLQGNDRQWYTSAEAPLADYRNLSPGYYVFKLSSKGFYGDWSKPAEYAFTILPPWWQTWWAYLLYVLLLGFVVVQAVRIRTKALEQQKKLLEHTVEVRTKELKITTKELEISLDELKDTQEELIRQEKLASIGQLTKGIVDRILNPLNYINNFSQSSVSLVEEVEEVIDKNKEGFSDDDRDDVEDSISMLKMSITKINEHGNSTARIVGDMQKLLKKRSTQFIDTEINTYLKTKIPVLLDEAMIKETNCPPVNLVFELADDAPLYVDLLPDEFEQALRNMVNNSCYALNEKSKLNKNCDLQLLVRTVLDGETVKIQLRDNGKGMVKKELEQICSPFFTTKPTAKGTGLGLFMSKDIVEDHRGSIDIASTEGEFTEVTISLPLREVELA
ncbi:MAG: hypothetical protein KKG00_09560 [Bacteroidetes bacterium]|nr:hypothetical protein [Bacteroidota bacterium]